jgi:hypothetical protein
MPKAPFILAYRPDRLQASCVEDVMCFTNAMKGFQCTIDPAEVIAAVWVLAGRFAGEDIHADEATVCSEAAAMP